MAKSCVLRHLLCRRTLLEEAVVILWQVDKANAQLLELLILARTWEKKIGNFLIFTFFSTDEKNKSILCFWSNRDKTAIKYSIEMLCFSLQVQRHKKKKRFPFSTSLRTKGNPELAVLNWNCNNSVRNLVCFILFFSRKDPNDPSHLGNYIINYCRKWIGSEKVNEGQSITRNMPHGVSRPFSLLHSVQSNRINRKL